MVKTRARIFSALAVKVETSCKSHKNLARRIIINFWKAKETFSLSFSVPSQWKTVKFLLFVTHINTHIIILTFHRDISVLAFGFPPLVFLPQIQGRWKTFSRDFIFVQNLCEKLLKGVHDDDCDIKIKINSIPSQKCKHFLYAWNLNARSRFFKFTPRKIKIYDRKNVKEKFFFSGGENTHMATGDSLYSRGIEDGKE